ncbi:hypothetical protein AAES_104323 [Amazona aestiva]|uniref:Uncharacterized protein n=1 Tax=Amazona aestiva TaxID=12930 RepID=A0A0Q3TFT0_AMAAE|nr:hypothetical protein AAES_104323 [Amazona aestiva]
MLGYTAEADLLQQKWQQRDKTNPQKGLLGHVAGFRKDTGKLNHSIYRTDFVFFPDHKPDQTLRRAMVEKLETVGTHAWGTKRSVLSLIFCPNSASIPYGICGIKPPGSKVLSIISNIQSFPVSEPPTNYGLLEHLMKKWHKKEAGVMNTVYTISYETPPIPAVATCHRRRPPKTPGLSFIQGSPPQNVSGILDYERLRNICKSSADW